MKKQIALYAIIAAALVAAPAITRAQDENHAKKPEAAETDAPKAKKHGAPFHGKVAAVDTTAKTVTVGNTTINITSETKITNEGKPATLSDIKVGEKISGAYKMDDAGKKNATVIHIGGKAKGEDKKKKTEEKTEKD